MTSWNPLRLPVPVVCPACRGPLRSSDDAIRCENCAQAFPYENGFPDLIIGGRFDDPDDAECLCYEEECNVDTAKNYWLPLFRRLFPNPTTPPTLLSLGAGVGVEVDMLTDAGYPCIGIDIGNRTHAWPRRVHPNRFLLANGKNLPFPDATFDAVFCGCVFPHVGVVGDTSHLDANWRSERQRVAAEMARVLKPSGRIIVSNPNRWCPFDIFHQRKSGVYRPRLNWPGHHFLCSVGDYHELFRNVGLQRARALPVSGYWGFVRARHTAKGRFFSLPVRAAFALGSSEHLRWLRGWPISPWIVVMIER